MMGGHNKAVRPTRDLWADQHGMQGMLPVIPERFYSSVPRTTTRSLFETSMPEGRPQQTRFFDEFVLESDPRLLAARTE